MRRNIFGFTPDFDSETDGAITDCLNYVPTDKGFTAANTQQATTLPALAAAATGAYVGKLLDGTKRVMVSTATKIYEAGVSSWTDRSRGGNYSGANATRFCMFGNFILSTNRSEVIQSSASGSAFADISGAPKASIIDSVAGFVMALNTNDATYGDRPDAWYCSAIYDQTVWTPSPSTQCATGRLVDTPGALTAGRALGNDFVAYKAGSMYLGRYVGSPTIWDWQRIPTEAGCSNQEAVVSANNAHYFIGPNDIWVYDGTSARSIGLGISRWFFSNLNASTRANIRGISDSSRDLIYWYYPTTSSGALDACIVYNYRSDKWGVVSGNIEVPLEYSSGQITWDGIGALGSTYDDLPLVSYDSGFWLADSTVPAVIDTSHTLKSLTAEPQTAYFVTGDVGDLSTYSFLNRVQPRFRQVPTSATCTNFYANEPDGILTTDATIAMSSRNRFDMRRSAHYHRVRIDTVGPCSLTALEFTINMESPE